MEAYAKNAKIAARAAYAAVFMIAFPYILWFHLLTPLLAKSYPDFITSLDIIIIFFCLNILFWGYAIPYFCRKNSRGKTTSALIGK